MLRFQQAQTQFHNDGVIPITAKTNTDKPSSAAASQLNPKEKGKVMLQRKRLT
jgi:hypothetical protein